MNKKFTIICLILLGAHTSSAAVIGNPAKPLDSQATTMSVGYDGEFLFGQDLEDGTELELTSHAARLSYTVTDRFAPFVILGAADAELGGDISGTSASIESDTGFMWGVGAAIPLYNSEDGFGFGITGQYRAANLDLSKATVGGVSASIPDSEVDYSEWLVAVGTSYTFDLSENMPLTGYLGVKYSDTTLEDAVVAGSSIAGDVNSDDNVGVFVGLEFDATENFSFGVEGRLIDEEALSIQGQLHF